MENIKYFGYITEIFQPNGGGQQVPDNASAKLTLITLVLVTTPDESCKPAHVTKKQVHKTRSLKLQKQICD